MKGNVFDKRYKGFGEKRLVFRIHNHLLQARGEHLGDFIASFIQRFYVFKMFDELLCAFGSDTFDTTDIITAIAHKALVVDKLTRQHAKFFLALLLANLDFFDRIVDIGVWIYELIEIFIVADNAHI